MVFDAISHKIDEVLSINTSTNVFVFGDFHHKDGLSYPGGADRYGELLCNFSISNDLTQRLTFLLRSLIVTLKVLLFWVYLFPLAPLLHGGFRTIHSFYCLFAREGWERSKHISTILWKGGGLTIFFGGRGLDRKGWSQFLEKGFRVFRDSSYKFYITTLI